jgi:hypothetical protein
VTAEHTPGPWRVVPPLDERCPWQVRATWEGQDIGIADVLINPPFDEGNTRLISAAPELLAAAQEWLRYETDKEWRDNKEREAERATAGNVSYAEALLYRLEEVIAKAEGRQL